VLLLQILNERFWLPLWPLVEVFTGRTFTVARDIKEVKRFAADVIKQRQALMAKEAASPASATASITLSSSKQGISHLDRDAGAAQEAADEGGVPRDLLSMFMEASGPDGKPLTNKQLIDTVLNFIIAGRDTTAQVDQGVGVLGVHVVGGGACGSGCCRDANTGASHGRVGSSSSVLTCAQVVLLVCCHLLSPPAEQLP